MSNKHNDLTIRRTMFDLYSVLGYILGAVLFLCASLPLCAFFILVISNIGLPCQTGTDISETPVLSDKYLNNIRDGRDEH